MKWPFKQDMTIKLQAGTSLTPLPTKLLLDLFLAFWQTTDLTGSPKGGRSYPWLTTHCFLMSLSNFLEKTMATKDCSCLEGKSASSTALLT